MLIRKMDYLLCKLDILHKSKNFYLLNKILQQRSLSHGLMSLNIPKYTNKISLRHAVTAAY